LAFHPYPQVIPTLCNVSGFGPPRACSARFSLPMGGSPGFGSTPRDSCPRRGGALSDSRSLRLRLGPGLASPRGVTRRLILQKARRHRGALPGSDRPWAHGFRISFTPLAGVLFTVPSRYWFAIGRRGYLALGGGPPRFPPDSACPAVLTQERHPTRPAVAYGTLTPSGGPFQRPSADWVVGARGLPTPPRPPSYPPTAPAAASAAVGVWAPPRSLAATKGILSLPPGTEMFQFPGCPPRLTPGCRGITPGGLPHSGTPGSPAASASPGRFVAWPRPSSARGA
jgi:hypothetical protein